MRSEEEIRKGLDECSRVAGFGLSEGPCPFNPEGGQGCCAECSLPSALRWVLGNDDGATDNGQQRLIELMICVGDDEETSTTGSDEETSTTPG